MTTVFKNVLSPSIGTTPTTILTSNASATTTVIGLSVTNTTSELSLVSIQLHDTIANTTAYYISNVLVPSYQSFRVVTNGEKLILGPSTTVTITASVANSLDVVMSWVEIS